MLRKGDRVRIKKKLVFRINNFTDIFYRTQDNGGCRVRDIGICGREARKMARSITFAKMKEFCGFGGTVLYTFKRSYYDGVARAYIPVKLYCISIFNRHQVDSLGVHIYWIEENLEKLNNSGCKYIKYKEVEYYGEGTRGIKVKQ